MASTICLTDYYLKGCEGLTEGLVLNKGQNIR